MDITEAFRTEDISKTDFFDFVVTPDNTQSFQSFTKQMRAVNVFLEDENGETKETNNNTLIDTSQQSLATLADNNSSAVSSSAYDPSFWTCDKETVRLETAILEDLNKYCWSQDPSDVVVTNNNSIINGAATSCPGNIISSSSSSNKLINNNNTDGHIYTLTVLNGVEQTNWYRPPLPAIIKEEDGSLSSPSPMEHMPQTALDIDSILNIIPNQLNGFNNNFEQQNTLSPHEGLTTDGLIKSETFTYDDSGYADTKDEIANSLIIDTPMLEAHDSFNNNNDWKVDNNNSTNAESLLRSALQGKTFVRCYNGNNSPQKKIQITNDTHSELRRALSTPPNKTEMITMDTADQHQHSQQQIMTVQLTNNNIVLYDDGGGGRIIHHQHPVHHESSDNPSSTQSMDDLLLSQLDTASYPAEDYEKLKRIANEVAESVQQYCQLESVDTNNIYVNASAGITVTNTNNLIQQPSTIMNPPPPAVASNSTAVVTSSKPTPKKYKRTNNNNNNSNSKNQSGTNLANNSNQIQTATSTSNGVRKERSLHYCSICSKGFKDKYSVNVHIRTHTGEKPFACSLCGKSFRQKAHLAKHYQTHIAQKNAAAAAAAAASSPGTNPNTTSNKKTVVVVPTVTTQQTTATVTTSVNTSTNNVTISSTTAVSPTPITSNANNSSNNNATLPTASR